MSESLNLNVYIDAGDIDKISKYCNEKFSCDVKETIRIADDVVNQTFKFEWKWDMERTFIPYTFEGDIVWDKTFNDDEEWIFMLNRHRYWVTLAFAYALTKNEIYVETFIKQASHWIDNVRPVKGNSKTTWRTIDTGVRCENWIKAYSYLQNSNKLNDEFKVKFITSLKEQAEYLYNNYQEHAKLSNWGVLENHGLLAVSLFIKDYEKSKTYIKTAIHRLEEQINLQVMKDGMHWEQSPMYLNEVLHCYLDTIILCRKNNIDIPGSILEKTKKLAYADLYMKKPNHKQVCQSDSDDTDLRDMITKASYLYNDGVLKFGGYKEIDFESVWDLGYSSIEKYKNIEIRKPEKTSYGFENSGNYYMRSGWNEDDNYLYFHCGTLGSGHGHADLLHVSIYANGEDYLIDPGRYTYIEGDEDRIYLKSCRAHNTTIVDNTDFTEIRDSWGYNKVATPITYPFISNNNYDYCEGSHLGYLNKGLFTNRKVFYIKPDIWILVDTFYGENKHKYNQIFHFAKDIQIEKNKTICKGNNGQLTLYHLNDIERSINKTLVSYHYNQIEIQDTLTTELENIGQTSIISVIHGSKEKSNLKVSKIRVTNCSGRILEDEEAEAIKIVHKDIKYILLVCHNEIYKGKKLLNVDGHDVYGKIVFIKCEGENITKEVVKY